MFRIFLTNLGKYNEGELIGEWVDLPVDSFDDVLERIGINDEYEEWFITDYETDYGFKIGEYDNIDDLNELAEVCEDADEDVIKALSYFGYDTADEIADHIDNVNYVTSVSGLESAEYAVGYTFAKEYGCLDIPDNLEPYFDYESYGRDIMIDGNFYEGDNGIYELCE